MEISVLTFVALVAVAFFSYKQLVAVFDYFLSDAPIIKPSWTAMLLRRSRSYKAMLTEAHEKYSKQGKAFRINSEIAIIPPSVLEQSRKLPTAVLSSSAANEETLYLSPSLGHDYWDVINFTRQNITRSIPSMIPALVEEIKLAWSNNFPPKDASSIEVDGKTFYATPLHPTVLKTVGQMSAKVLFGKKYSRDPQFIKLATDYATGIQIQALIMQTFVPLRITPFVKKFIMPHLPTATRARIIGKAISEDVLACLDADESQLESQNAEGGSNFTLLPLMVKYVQKNPEYKGANPSKIVNGVMGRTLGLLFAAVDTTTITFTQLTFDLIGHPKAQYADPILEEAKTVLAKHGGVWSLAALGELRLLDSMIKESQRMHPIGIALGGRKVMAEGGFTFTPPEPGAKPIYFPKGSTFSTPLSGVHADEDYYHNANQFKGFRFAQDAVPSSQPSDKFMSFGHGRHACPGRHLALNMLKLMTIEFLSNYEWVEIDRPDDIEFSVARIPDMKRSIHVRKV